MEISYWDKVLAFKQITTTIAHNKVNKISQTNTMKY